MAYFWRSQYQTLLEESLVFQQCTILYIKGYETLLNIYKNYIKKSYFMVIFTKSF